MALNQVTVGNPTNTSNADGASVTALAGKAGEQIAAELCGKYYTRNYRNGVFAFSQAAVTLPVNATTLVSKLGVYNPLGSGKNLELICFDMAYVVATTVVNGVGLYYSNGTNASGATFTTAGTIISGVLGGGGTSVATGYSAVTHVGTPTLGALLAYTGAVTSTAVNSVHYDFDGRVIVPPGTLLAVAMTTAASTASGFTGMLHWAEVPV